MIKSFFIVLICASVITTGVAAYALEKDNRIQFGSVTTGESLNAFIKLNKGYTKADPESWLKFSSANAKDGMWAPAPDKDVYSNRVLSKLSTIVVSTQKPECGKVSRLLYLGSPPRPKGKPDITLYAYEYILCDITGFVSSSFMLDQYISKYGMYDLKDYDRGLVVYNDVKKRFRVGVKPYTADKEKAGLAITIVDNQVFRDKYLSWRIALKEAYKTVRNLF